jgi:hypothetical protein
MTRQQMINELRHEAAGLLRAASILDGDPSTLPNHKQKHWTQLPKNRAKALRVQRAMMKARHPK